jgi:hypothetical protein
MSIIHKEQKHPTDDDEEKLVQQVLAENPPEDRGKRDEWANHVGWHRKEDSGVGVVNLKESINPNKDIAGNPPKAETFTDLPKKMEGVSKSLRGSRSREKPGLNTSDLLLVLIAIGCVFSALRAIMRKRHNKQRTS